MAEAKKEPPQKPRKKSGKGATFLVTMALLIAAPFIMPTIALILIGLVPTYVAFATDGDRQKSGAISVGAMNIAGIAPFVIDLWEKGQTMPNAFQMLGNANNWVVILGAAAIGQLVVYAIPQAIATITLTHAESRAKLLRKNLETLKEFWGPEVATTKPIDKIAHFSQQT